MEEPINYRQITAEDDASIAEIARYNLKKHGLDLPGTVYFDDDLDHLSDFYLAKGHRRYYYVLAEGDQVIGGIGLAEFEFFDNCAELQKLYLTDDRKGKGLGYRMISLIEDKARELGYERMYLETHTNLESAIHIYEKCGYEKIEKPAGVVHATMNTFFIKDLRKGRS